MHGLQGLDLGCASGPGVLVGDDHGLQFLGVPPASQDEGLSTSPAVEIRGQGFNGPREGLAVPAGVDQEQAGLGWVLPPGMAQAGVASTVQSVLVPVGEHLVGD